MSTFSVIWFSTGLVLTLCARWAYRLTFRDRLTLGGILAVVLGIALPPITLIAFLVMWISWLVDPDQHFTAVKWPDWWGRMRYRQHVVVRWAWHLGNPPVEEGICSGWRRVPKRWKSAEQPTAIDSRQA